MMTQTPSRTPADWWPELAPVREAAATGRLTLGRCPACERAHYYPRDLCPFCLAPAGIETARGDGVIYSVSVARRGPGAPSAVAYVTLSEGVSVLARLREDDLAIGDTVQLSGFITEDDALVPVFAAAVPGRSPTEGKRE